MVEDSYYSFTLIHQCMHKEIMGDQKGMWVAQGFLYHTMLNHLILGVLLSEIFQMVSSILKINEVRYHEYRWLIYIGFSIQQSQGNTNTPAIAHKIQNNFACNRNHSFLFLSLLYFSWIPSIPLLFSMLIFFICFCSLLQLCYFCRRMRILCVMFGLFYSFPKSSLSLLSCFL